MLYDLEYLWGKKTRRHENQIQKEYSFPRVGIPVLLGFLLGFQQPFSIFSSTY